MGLAQDAETVEPAPANATTTPAVIDVSDKAALEANKEKQVTVVGTCSGASWSSSGKVMNISFAGAEESRFGAVMFEKNKQKMDAAFGGDAAKAWTGAKLRIRGKLSTYGGKVAARLGETQIIINDSSQVTVVEPAPAATQPAE